MIKRIIKAIIRRLKGQSGENSHKEWLLQHGLRAHYVSHKPWREWANPTDKEWAELRAACSETYRYITTREDV